MSHQPSQPHTLRVVSRLLRHAPPLHTRPHQPAAPTPLPLHLTRCDTHAPSPARPLFPHTRSVRPPDTAPGRPSGSNAFLLLLHISPPSPSRASHIHGSRHDHQCTVPLPLRRQPRCPSGPALAPARCSSRVRSPGAAPLRRAAPAHSYK